MKIIVLGCGLVGKAIVGDLAKEKDIELTVVDANEAALEAATRGLDVKAQVMDLRKSGATTAAVKGQELVVGAVPGWLGRDVVREVIEAGKPIADISFMPEDPFELDGLAKEKGVAAIVDCGIAPGTSNLLVGRAASELDEIVDVNILVGGLPVIRRLPYEYGVVFSAVDVLEEYTRPAYIIENGSDVVKPALSELEQVEVPGVGTLEAFLTDGLRSLRRNIDAANMKEMTMRYPGHCERMRMLVETGFLDEEPIDVGGVSIRPRDVTAELLSRAWQLEPGEEDLTVLHVEVGGRQGGVPTAYTYDLIDVYDSENEVTSMARTTGYACTAMVKLFVKGMVTEAGVIAPEQIGKRPELCEEVLVHLADRGINIAETVSSES